MQTGNCFEQLPANGGDGTSWIGSWVEDELNTWLWPLDAEIGDDGHLWLFLAAVRNERGAGAAIGAEPLGTWRARYRLPDLELIDLEPAEDAVQRAVRLLDRVGRGLDVPLRPLLPPVRRRRRLRTVVLAVRLPRQGAGRPARQPAVVLVRGWVDRRSDRAGACARSAMSDKVGSGFSRRKAIAGIVEAVSAPSRFPPLHRKPTTITPRAPSAAKGAEAAVPATAWTPAFLSDHQYALLEALAERIVPRSGEAQVSRFVDTLLAVDTREAQRAFLESLSAFDAAALARHSKPFAKLTADEQDGVLAAAVAQEEARAGSETSWGWFAVPAAAGGKSAPDLGAHLKNLKRWISGAYYSSETGMKELGWTSHRAFEAFPACTHAQHGADEPDTSR